MPLPPSIPDIADLRKLRRGLKRARIEWIQHVHTVDAQTPLPMSIEFNDTAVPLSDCLAILVKDAALLDFRLDRLLERGYEMGEDYDYEPKYCTVESLLSYVDDKVVSTETASTVLRRAAAEFHHEIQTETRGMIGQEEDLTLKLDFLVHDALWCIWRYNNDGLDGKASLLQELTADLEASAREPEYAIYARKLRQRLDDWEAETFTKELARDLAEEEALMLCLFSRAATAGVVVGERQALVTEYFDKV